MATETPHTATHTEAIAQRVGAVITRDGITVDAACDIAVALNVPVESLLTGGRR